MNDGSPLLSVRNLSVRFPVSGDLVSVVEDVSFEVSPGEIVALVGESGSGKTMAALATVALTPDAALLSGEVRFEGGNVLAMSERERCRIRGGGIGFVFQEPGAALDPVRKIGPELVTVIRRHRGLSRDEARKEALRLLEKVALPEPTARFHDYPHRMSGGMRQRAMLALALAGKPRLLIADEPTTALDTTIQAQILDLLGGLAAELGLGVLLITHDLGVVRDVAGKALVMYAGRIVESGPVTGVLSAPAHPYTRALLDCLPGIAARHPKSRLPVLAGTVPAPGEWPPGCAFSPRCARAVERCSLGVPAPGEWQDGVRRAACFRSGEDVP